MSSLHQLATQPSLNSAPKITPKPLPLSDFRSLFRYIFQLAKTFPFTSLLPFKVCPKTSQMLQDENLLIKWCLMSFTNSLWLFSSHPSTAILLGFPFNPNPKTPKIKFNVSSPRLEHITMPLLNHYQTIMPIHIPC